MEVKQIPDEHRRIIHIDLSDTVRLEVTESIQGGIKTLDLRRTYNHFPSDRLTLSEGEVKAIMAFVRDWD